MSTDPLIGTRISNYIVKRQIGRGGMGVVYEAVHEDIGQRIAIKVLYLQLAHDKEYVGRFVREGRACSMVHHESLVRIFGFGQVPNGPPYILMEYLEGELLRKRLHRLPSSRQMVPLAAVHIVRQLAAALRAAHQVGIVHRDIKPENIMLIAEPEAPNGERAKLLDFGIAKFMTSSGRSSVRTGQVLGTPYYMSPEQLLNASAVGPPSDVFSLGVVLFEMLSGHSLKVRDFALAVTAQSNLEQLVRRELPPSLPEPLRVLTLRMLDSVPDARPAMSEVAATLKQLLWALGDPEAKLPPSAWSLPGHNRSAAPEEESGPSLRKLPLLPADEPKELLPSERSLLAPPPAPDVGAETGARHTEASPPPKVEVAQESPVPRITAAPSVKDAASSTTKKVRRIRLLWGQYAAGAGLGFVVLLVLLSRTYSAAPAPDAELIFLSGGGFTMGSSREEVRQRLARAAARGCKDCLVTSLAHERPEHIAFLRPYYMERTEVSIGAFADWLNKQRDLAVREDGRVLAGDRLLLVLAPEDPAALQYRAGRFSAHAGTEMLPMTRVTWDAAGRFCQARGRRLPTEAEWELAARAGSGRGPFPWGSDEPSCAAVAFARSAAGACAALGRGPARVGTAALDRTPQGITDLGGNVAEWVQDRYRRSHVPCVGGCRDPLVLENTTEDGGPLLRVVRGGSWAQSADSCSATHRRSNRQDLAADDIGFRCVQSAGGRP